MNGKYGYVNKAGKEIILPVYNEAQDFCEGLAQVKLNGKYGYLDKTGKEVILPIYDSTYYLTDGLVKVLLKEKYGLLDKAGNKITPLKYTKISDFSEGYALVIERKDNNDTIRWYYGFIDKSGEEVIPLTFGDAGNFSEGLAYVLSNDNRKYGYIDKNGKEVIPFFYQYASDFNEGLAKVRFKTNSHIMLDGGLLYRFSYDRYIDKNGELELCKSPLLSYIQKINNHRLTLHNSSRSSGSFIIDRPYLIITALSNKCDDIYFQKYSEEIFNANSVSGLKTLIAIYEYHDKSQSYGYLNQVQRVLFSSGIHIIYFDMLTNKIIGYDNMRANKFPDTISADSRYQNDIEWSFDEIIEKIDSHLATL